LAVATFALPNGSPIAPVSSLTPVVRKEAAEVLPERRPLALRRWLAIGGLLAAGSAAAAAFVVSQRPFDAGASLTMSAASAHGVTASDTGAPVRPVPALSTHVAGSGANVAAPSGARMLAGSGASATAPSVASVAAPSGARMLAGSGASATTPSVASVAAASGTAVPAREPPPSNSASADKPAALAAADPNAGSPKPATAAAPADDKPAAPKNSVAALFDLVKLSGGKLNPAQLSAALEKTTPKLEHCYAQLLKKKPRAKGRLTFQWTVRLNGKIASLKKLSDTINDVPLTQCTQQAILDTRFPKPRKQAVQVKLPFEYRRVATNG
jgi:hypothetical protein